eukprot:4275687-Pyramimonas_sp.AAC.1
MPLVSVGGRLADHRCLDRAIRAGTISLSITLSHLAARCQVARGGPHGESVRLAPPEFVP